MIKNLRRRDVVAVAAAAVLGALVAGAVRAGAAQQPFVVNMSSAPATLDPAEVSNAADGGFLNNFYVTLTQHGTKMGPNGYPQDDFTKVEPYLATKWKPSDGFKTWTFTLRKGAVFPSGKPMDAYAVKYSFDRMLTRNSSGAGIGLNANYPAGFVTGIEAPNAT